MIRRDNRIKLEVCRRDFLHFLMDGKREITDQDAQKRAERLNWFWMKPPFVVAAVAPDYSGVAPEDKDDLIYDYEDHVCAMLDDLGYDGACVTDSKCQVMVLLSLAQVSQNATELDEAFSIIHHKLYMHFGRGLFIGIGGVVDALDKINTSAADAQEMLAYKFQYSSRGVINISNIRQFSYVRFVGNSASVERVIGCFQDGDMRRMTSRLNELIEQIRNRPGVSKTSIRRTMVELVINVLNIASNAGVEVDAVLEGRDPYHWILSQGHTEDIVEWFLEICSKLIAAMHERQHREENHTLSQAYQYIGENLHRNDLSLLQVSAHVGLSGAYFSQLFKRETGEGLSAYITRSRVERAKELLVSTDLKIEDIALQVGFSTANYFSTVFKNTAGQTPAEYRRMAKA